MFEMSCLICAKIYEQFIQKLFSHDKYKYLRWQTVHIIICELLISDHIRLIPLISESTRYILHL